MSKNRKKMYVFMFYVLPFYVAGKHSKKNFKVTSKDRAILFEML